MDKQTDRQTDKQTNMTDYPIVAEGAYNEKRKGSPIGSLLGEK